MDMNPVNGHEVGFEEIAIDLSEARLWRTSGWPLAWIGSASEYNFWAMQHLDPRRFDKEVTRHCQSFKTPPA
jgi:hypothetical protein